MPRHCARRVRLAYWWLASAVAPRAGGMLCGLWGLGTTVQRRKTRIQAQGEDVIKNDSAPFCSRAPQHPGLCRRMGARVHARDSPLDCAAVGRILERARARHHRPRTASSACLTGSARTSPPSPQPHPVPAFGANGQSRALTCLTPTCRARPASVAANRAPRGGRRWSSFASIGRRGRTRVRGPRRLLAGCARARGAGRDGGSQASAFEALRDSTSSYAARRTPKYKTRAVVRSRGKNRCAVCRARAAGLRADPDGRPVGRLLAFLPPSKRRRRCAMRGATATEVNAATWQIRPV